MVFVAIECSQQGDWSLWAKKKYKKEAEEHAAHLPAWLVKEYGEAILTKLDLYIQDLVSSVVWIDRVLLYPEDIVIDQASKVTIDQLINIEELDIDKRKKSVIAIEDAILGSIGSQTIFREKSVGFVLEADLTSNVRLVV